MKKIKVLVVDDEPLARSGLRKLLEKDEDLEIVAEAPNGRAALVALAEKPVDLLFLDVQMPGLSGIQVLEQIPAGRRPVIIFTTAYDEYAVKAFELHAVDYLLKPFSNRRFVEAVERAKASHRSRSGAQIDRQLDELRGFFQRNGKATPAAAANALPERLVVKADGELHFIDYRDILWIEGQGDYLKIHSGKQAVMIRETMSRMEARLAGTRLVRVHKSAIVNLAHVRKLKPLSYGDHSLELMENTAVRVGRAYREKLASLLDT
jgi:two-component system LytT family response regulator